MISQYMKRIHMDMPKHINLDFLVRLHRQHVYHIPFENLSIKAKQPLSLDLSDLFKKVVAENRGGFCYELNHLFYGLLTSLNYDCDMIAARIFKEDVLGPPLDHMAIWVRHTDHYLCDVGYGDLFRSPMKLLHGFVQDDGINRYKIIQNAEKRYTLYKSNLDNALVKRYEFELIPRSIDEFQQICQEKQTSSDSHFVKNLICSRATNHGRQSVFNEVFIVNDNGVRTEEKIASQSQLFTILKTQFGVEMNGQLTFPDRPGGI